MDAPEPRRRSWRAALVGQVGDVTHLLRQIALGAASGALAGLASFAFLESLDRVTDWRLAHGWLIWLLPAAGVVIGLALHHLAGRASGGNALLLEEIHQPTAWIPRRMAPLVFVGTLASHLFGASVGREGTALQMSGSLTDALSRRLRLGPDERRLLLIASIAGGFGSVFGVPLAGTVFALEVQTVGRVRYEALVPALTAAVVGDLVVGGLGYDHAVRAPSVLAADAGVVARVALAGIAFGLVALAFTSVVHGVGRVAAARGRWLPLRLAVGGLLTLAMVALVGRDYLGLSLGVLDSALAGHDPAAGAFAWKLAFTAVALGSGFPGGEVTPLFVIGASLGAALAGPLGLDPASLAGIGMVALLAGAANTPLACTIMGAELFGGAALVPTAVGCVVAYVFSGHRGIYGSQRIEVTKGRPR